MGRTTATILFTDLVGSTELRGRLGEEAADQLRRKHDDLLVKAVEANNGRVVKGLGDGIMAAFAGAADAVSAAVAIQQAVDRLNRSGKMPMPLAVRVGLSAGDVTFEDDDVHGTPVIEAARLCAAAVGGEVLASEVVRWLGGAHGAPSLIPVGSLDLKGLAAPVPAVRIEWEPAVVSSIPMPALLTDIGRIFVGRQRELERLGQLWKEAAAGERRVALLAGEPGVGKTRLAAELAITVHEQGAVVLAGRCDEDLGVPYQPFVEALRHFVDHTPRAELRDRLGRYGGELARLVPELAERVPDLPAPLQSDPETERYRLFDAVAAWLGAASDGEAVLLVLDDLQWAAKPTLMLVRHVARSVELKGLLLVGTYRDSDLGHNHPLAGVVADLRRQIGLERISLHGLDAAGVAAYMEQAAGHALDGADMGLARAIYEETEGNLFFVKEVLRHLTETGGIRRRDGRWVTGLPIDELGIPEGVRDVVGRRLARLSEAANDLLGIAAVAGVEFELAVLGVAAGLDDDALTVAVDEAMTARLVTDVAGAPGRCRFAHALVRDTLYSDLSGVRRPSLHRRVADAIELLHAGRLEDHLPALVHHYARAGGRRAETLKAVDYAVWAGDRALAQLANDEAVAYYREALDLLSMGDWPVDEPRRLALLISLGEAECRAGDPVHRSTLLEAAALAGERRDASALARAALANTRGLLPTRIGRVDAEKVSVLEAALAAVGDRDLRTRARLLATLGLELVFAGDWRRCLELSDEAVALARSLGDPDTLARVLLARYFPTSVPGLLEDRLANTATLVDTADAVADPALQAEANLLCGRAAMEAGDVERASRCYDLADRLSAGLGQPALRWRVRYVQTAQAIAAGNLLDAETLLGEARDVGRLAGQDGTEWVFAWQLCLLRLEQGRVDEEVVTCLEAARWEHGTPPMDSLLALAACELGRDADAAAEMYRLATAPVAFDIYWLVTMTHWALVAVHLGDTVQASGLESALRPYAGQAIAFSPGPRPSVAHHLGVLSTALGRYQQAERDFAAALTIHERIRAPHWTARTGLEWARMLLTRRQPGDAERARVLLAEALATARELELATLEGQAVQLLQDCP